MISGKFNYSPQPSPTLIAITALTVIMIIILMWDNWTYIMYIIIKIF